MAFQPVGKLDERTGPVSLDPSDFFAHCFELSAFASRYVASLQRVCDMYIREKWPGSKRDGKQRDDYTFLDRNEILCGTVSEYFEHCKNIVKPAEVIGGSLDLMHRAGVVHREGIMKREHVHLSSVLN